MNRGVLKRPGIKKAPTMPIVLVEPQIPQNTGSIARSCAATNTPLHIVGPIPFDISEKAVRRAGLDYWPHVNLTYHTSWDNFITKAAPLSLWYLSTKGSRPYYETHLAKEDYLVFGSETKGLGTNFLARVPQNRVIIIPMENPNVRSLNLSNAVSILLFDQLRQCAVG